MRIIKKKNNKIIFDSALTSSRKSSLKVPKDVYAYDTESFGDAHTFVFKGIDSGLVFKYRYNIYVNELPQLLNFIIKLNKSGSTTTGYNSAIYDDQLVYCIYLIHSTKFEFDNKQVLKSLNIRELTPKNLTPVILKKISQACIDSEWGLYRDYEVASLFPRSIDLMQLNNYGIKSAKSSSLKKLEFSFRRKKIADLPVKHYAKIKSKKTLDDIDKYCVEDIDATIDVWHRSKSLMDYRRDFGNLVGMNFMSDPETRLAKKYVVRELSKAMGISEKEFKKLKTYRDKIEVKDLIIPFIKFNDPINQGALDYYKNKILYPSVKSKVDPNRKIISLKNAINYEFTYPNGLTTKIGAGGIHGVVPNGIYRADDKYCLLDIDFGSWYPHLMHRYKISPGHIPGNLLGDILMKWYHERSTKFPKKTHFTLNYALKIIMNLCYGLGGSEYGPLYDDQFTLEVCVNGIFLVMMLSEKVFAFNEHTEVIYQNTDGIVIKTRVEDRDAVLKMCYDFAKSIDIPLEHEEFEKLVLLNVNHFIAKYKDSDYVKRKGMFATYDDIISQHMYHKDTSAMIIPEALTNYFLNDIPVEETIYNCDNIHDFCYGVKGGSSFEYIESTDKDNSNPDNPVAILKEIRDYNLDDLDPDVTNIVNYKLVLQDKKGKGMSPNIITNKYYNERMVRYYITQDGKGATLAKMWNSESKKGFSFVSVEADKEVKILQNIKKEQFYERYKDESIKIKNKSRYPDLDFDYYIYKCREIIDDIEGVEYVISN